MRRSSWLTGRDAARLPFAGLGPQPAESVDLLLKHGFVYDSSMMGHDYIPYQARNGDRISLLEPMQSFGPDTKPS